MRYLLTIFYDISSNEGEAVLNALPRTGSCSIRSFKICSLSSFILKIIILNS